MYSSIGMSIWAVGRTCLLLPPGPILPASSFGLVDNSWMRHFYFLLLGILPPLFLWGLTARRDRLSEVLLIYMVCTMIQLTKPPNPGTASPKSAAALLSAGLAPILGQPQDQCGSQLSHQNNCNPWRSCQLISKFHW